MIIVDRLLAKRESEGRPVRVGLVGQTMVFEASVSGMRV